MIDTKALARELNIIANQVVEDWDNANPGYDGDNEEEITAMLAEMIVEQQAARLSRFVDDMQRDGWICVKDRLPGERGKYLCVFAGTGQEVLFWDMEEWYDKTGIRDPIRWMPLPEAPHA